MKQYRALSVALGLFVASAAASVQAQIDSDPPLLSGQKSYHLYSVAAVLNNGMASVFGCTNMSSDAIIVGVEAFGPAGGVALNDASATSVTLSSGGTVLFTTQDLAQFTNEINLALGAIHGGSARILSTSRSGLVCTAFLAAPSNPASSMTTLSIVKKTKQKGD
jgi:hypothetical protein